VLTCFSSTENTIRLQVCAGATGAPAGFSVQWMSCSDYAANGNAWYASDDKRLCKASFSGNANGTAWNLGANACTTVVIGGLNDADPGVSFTCNEPLACNTCYVFRAFAHATSKLQRSDFTANLQCFTAACKETGLNDGDFCTKSQGIYGNGVAGRDLMVGCFGGDPTGAACTSIAGSPILSIGGGTFTYSWVMTGTCVDLVTGPGVFLMDSGLANLRTALGGGGGGAPFTANGNNATNMGAGGGLASQTAALTLNIALSGNGCSGFPAGFGAAVLCKFAAGSSFVALGAPLTQAQADALNGQSVSQVLAAVNAYLGGAGVIQVPYGLGTAGVLNELVSNLNLSFHDPYTDAGGVTHDCGDMNFLAESFMCKA
jgi:hypothetical protein